MLRLRDEPQAGIPRDTLNVSGFLLVSENGEQHNEHVIRQIRFYGCYICFNGFALRTIKNLFILTLTVVLRVISVEFV